MLNNYIRTNNLLPGDAVVVRKDILGLLDHYLIYLGIESNRHQFIVNYGSGTRILQYSDIYEFSREYSPSRIRRFLGNHVQRRAAVNRALNQKDQDSYHLILNNCEHFANYVQSGTSYSQQTTVFGTGLAISGLALAASSKNDEGKGLGLAMTLFGMLTLAIESNNNK